MRRSIAAGVALSIPAAFLLPVLTATPAYAPSPVAIAWAAQIALGYSPCKPIVSPLPADVEATGAAADADNGEQSGKCEIRISPNVLDRDLEWLAWHEVAHLSTVSRIYADPISRTMADPAHCHPLFTDLLAKGPAEAGGYGPCDD
jgi:hypothetical protein